MTTINQQEAGAFYTTCAMRGLSTAEALELLNRSTWPDLREDLAFGRRRHTPTIRRLARPLLMRLDAEIAASAQWLAEQIEVSKRYLALSDKDRAAISAAIASAGGNERNRRARSLADALGIPSRSIDELRCIVAGYGPTGGRGLTAVQGEAA